MRCALPGFSSSRWLPADPSDRVFMGRLPVLGNTAIGELWESGWEDPAHPPDTHEDGCPGAWYRCEFVKSVARYERLLGYGTFSENILLSRTDDPLVIEATQYIESHRLRRHEHDSEADSKS